MSEEDKKQFDLMRGEMSMLRISSDILYKIGEITLKEGEKGELIKIGAGTAVSSIILYAFSCEIGLKTLILKTGKDKKRTHDLKELFEILPDDIKDSIKKEVTEKVGGDFDTQIDENKEVFETWRYFYEKGNLHAGINFLRIFSEVIYNECNK